MTLLDVPTYRRLTRDTTTPDADLAEPLADAQQLVEDYLRRELARAERTERLRVYRLDDGRRAVYPRATPIVTVPVGLTVEGAAVVGADLLSGFAAWSGSSTGYASLTYTGGYLLADLPLTIAREIARTARALLTPTLTLAHAGAKTVRVGDVTVSYDRPVGGALDPASERVLRPYRRRHA